VKRWHGWFVPGVVVVSLAALAAFDRAWLPSLRRGPDMAQALWIWAPGDWRHPRTLGFFAAADLWLEKGAAVARLNITADEEFVVWVNGSRAGSGRYDRGRPMAAFDLSHRLVAGGNRVVAELRSSRGAGGFLAWLEVDGMTLAATGPDWRVFRDSRPGLLRGWLPLESGEAPQIWGEAPMARWAGLVPSGAAKAGFAEHWVEGLPLEAARGQRLGFAGPSSFAAVSARPVAGWQRDWRQSTPLPQVRGAVALDWEREITGYIELDFVGEGDALLFASAEAPPDPARFAASAVIVRASGQSVWRDSVPRRFRYLLVAGEPRLVGARAYETSEQAWVPTPPAVLLGVPRPPSRPAVEDKLRREFQGFAGFVLGQGG
jgi:hypothetical protein